MPPPGETIPVGKKTTNGTEWVEAYLIQSNAIDGASGSPVMTRPSLTFVGMALDEKDKSKTTDVIWTEAPSYLLGVFQAAWFLPPDDPLRKAVQTNAGDVVPVGLGVVVPAYKIAEMLEDPKLQKERASRKPIGTKKVPPS